LRRRRRRKRRGRKKKEPKRGMHVCVYVEKRLLGGKGRKE